MKERKEGRKKEKIKVHKLWSQFKREEMRKDLFYHTCGCITKSYIQDDQYQDVMGKILKVA